VIEAVTSERNDFEVFPENWDALEIFLALTTQWVIGGIGVHVGLNYQSVEFLFKIYNVRDKRQMLDDLRAIEAGALKKFREAAEK
jgi:Phage related hypothetical protein (DUF1799)